MALRLIGGLNGHPSAGLARAQSWKARLWLLTGSLLAAALVLHPLDIGEASGRSKAQNALSVREPAALQAAGTFIVEGTLSNGTAGGAVPSGVQVRVIGFTGAAGAQSWDATTDAAGGFRIEGIDRIDGATYAVGVDYADATYLDRVTPPAPGNVANGDLIVYESSGTDPGIRFEQSAIVLSTAEEGQRTLAVVEIHAVTNPSDRAFVPRSDGPGGPAGLLVFPLPVNASEVTPEIGLDPDRIVQIDRGFASFTPILPGRVEIVFRYRLPYTTTTMDFTRTARYPIASFQVLSPTDGPRIESGQMVAAESAAVGGRQFQRLSGGPLAPGNNLTFTISGLPLPGGVLALVPPWTLALGGIILGVVAIVVSWVRGQRRVRRDALDQPEEVVERIVALDLALAEGRLSAEEHRVSRDALIDVAARHMAARGRAAGEVDSS